MNKQAKVYHAHFGGTRERKSKRLLESLLQESSDFITRYPVPGDNLVEKGHPKYLAPGEPELEIGLPDGYRQSGKPSGKYRVKIDAVAIGEKH